MARVWSIVLGIGLVILGLAGLNTPAGTWIGWLDIAGGIISFVVAGSAAPRVAAPVSAVGGVRHQSYRDARGLLFLCAGLFAMWIVGLVTKSVTPTMAWWNFAFACAYGLLAIGSYSGRGMMRNVPASSTSIDDREQRGPRRVA